MPPKSAPDGGEFPVLVGARSAPFLADHVVRDVPVLAAALVVEWFARAVRGAYPARRLSELDDLRVLRGVPLPDFATRPLLLVVKVLPGDAPDRVRLELHDSAGHVRYSAGGILRAADEFSPAPPLAPSSGADWPFELDAIYDGPLFHGPRFQTVVGLDSMAADGGSGRLIGTAELGWEGGPFLTDPAALDGCLQLPMLWGGHHLRRQSLPTRIGRLVLCAAGPAAGESICQFRAVHHRDGLSADVLLADAAGRPILFVGGLEMVALTAPREAPVA